MKAIEVASISAALLFLAYLVELARDNGILAQSIAVALLVLMAATIGGSVVWFDLHIPAGLH